MADRGVNEQDFDEYDPTPYGGGYDQVAFYGRPKPPSDETCYPLSAHADCSDDFSHGYGGTKAPYRPAHYGGGCVDEGRPTFQPDRPSRPSYGEENEGFGSGYGRPPVPAYHAEEEYGGRPNPYGRHEEEGYGEKPYGRPYAYPHPPPQEEGFGEYERPYAHARPPPHEEPYHEEPPKPFGYGGDEENRHQSSSHYAHLGRKKFGRSDSSDEEEEKNGHGRRPHGYGETEEGSGGFQGYSEEDGSHHKHHHWGHHNDD